MFTTCETQLIHEHLPLVRSIAFGVSRRLPANVDVDDLISAGTEGLLTAVRRYDALRCPHFEAYASGRIRGAIYDELRGYDFLTRYGRDRTREIARVVGRHETRSGRAPTEGEIADSLGISLPKYQRLAAALWRRSEASDEAASDATQETGLLARELKARLAHAITTLPARTQRAVLLYYRDGCRQHEIGKVLGVTESRVCQILGRAALQLRALLDR